jgi:uncharacterized protein YodC (DUF2158 family)
MCAVNENNMEKGALVRLKSGGPVMTVRAVSLRQAYCNWTEGAVHMHGTFDVDTLVPVCLDEAARRTSPPGK